MSVTLLSEEMKALAIRVTRDALTEAGRPDLAVALDDQARFPHSTSLEDRRLLYRASAIGIMATGQRPNTWCFPCWVASGFGAIPADRCQGVELHRSLAFEGCTA